MKQAIFAVGDNNELGLDQGLPWSGIEGDLPTFKSLTHNTTLVMGRATYNSLPIKPSDKREFIVVTNNPDTLEPQPFIYVIEPSKLIELLATTGRRVSVIGGATVLTKEVLEMLDAIYMTRVKGTFEADVFLSKEVTDYVESLPNKVTIFDNEQATMVRYAE